MRFQSLQCLYNPALLALILSFKAITKPQNLNPPNPFPPPSFKNFNACFNSPNDKLLWQEQKYSVFLLRLSLWCTCPCEFSDIQYMQSFSLVFVLASKRKREREREAAECLKKLGWDGNRYNKQRETRRRSARDSRDSRDGRKRVGGWMNNLVPPFPLFFSPLC